MTSCFADTVRCRDVTDDDAAAKMMVIKNFSGPAFRFRISFTVLHTSSFERFYSTSSEKTNSRSPYRHPPEHLKCWLSESILCAEQVWAKPEHTKGESYLHKHPVGVKKKKQPKAAPF